MRYPRYTFFVLVVFLSQLSVKAQSSLSVFGGANISSRTFNDIKNEYTYSFQSITSYNIGALYEHDILNYLALSSGLMINSRGYIFKLPLGMVYYENKIIFQYVDIPLNIKLKYVLNDKFNLFSTTGLYTGYIITGKRGTTISTASGIKEYPMERIKQEQLPKNRWDFGINLGGGFEFHRFYFSTTYSIGLLDLSKSAYSTIVSKNWAIVFNVGYRFKLNREKEE
jgi:hypothetical protein